MTTYRWLAEYYDAMFEPARHAFAAVRAQVLEGVLPSVESACDLACGTGTSAVLLARMGVRIYGVDLSPGMVRATREKAKREGVRIRVQRSDMREFRLPEPVDLVTCEFDAINHVPRKSDLKRVLRCVARALKPGGWFYFDTNNIASFQQLWRSTFLQERDGVVMVMHGGSKGEWAWSDVEWFVREKDGRYRRHRERVEEVCWSAAEMRAALRGAGFHRIRAWDASTFFENDTTMRPGIRTFWLARKALST